MEAAIERLSALSLFVIGLSHILAPAAWTEFFLIVKRQGKAAGLINAFVHFPIGAMIVSFHWTWDGPAAVVTLYGCLLTLKGAVLFACPSLVERSLNAVAHERAWASGQWVRQCSAWQPLQDGLRLCRGNRPAISDTLPTLIAPKAQHATARRRGTSRAGAIVALQRRCSAHLHRAWPAISRRLPPSAAVFYSQAAAATPPPRASRNLILMRQIDYSLIGSVGGGYGI